MVDVQKELDSILEKYKTSNYPNTFITAKRLEYELNKVLFLGVSNQTIKDDIYFNVEFSNGNIEIQQIKGSILVWYNKGAMNENW